MRRAYAGFALAFSLGSLGCNPTAGLSDSADAALPQIKRYFDGRGSQLADGPWTRVVVDLDTETLYHVGGRRRDDEQLTFHLFGADARDGCQVTPNAGTWLMGKPLGAPFRVLPFLESMDGRGRGRLRFTQLDCTVQELVVEDAGRPYPRLYDRGFLVPTKEGYTFADPWRGTTLEVAAKLEAALVWNKSVLLWADDTLKSFSEQFDPGETWGNAPVAALAIKDDFLVEDTDGLHHVTFDADSLEIDAEDVLPDACHLQHASVAASDGKTAWVVAEQPCGAKHPSILHIDSKTFELLDTFELPLDADARYTRALIGNSAEASAFVPVGAAYLTDEKDGLGTLWIWRADSDAPIKLGERADLDDISLSLRALTITGTDESPTEDVWDGAAQINYQDLDGYLAHDWIQFRWDGTTRVLAERVVRNSSSGETLFNFDGAAGDLPKPNIDGTFSIIAKGIPGYSGEATSYTGDRHYARVDSFDGDSGRLLLGTLSHAPSDWSGIANHVPPELARFAWFMPAIVFIEDWDAEKKTGSLVAYNYELDARSTIADGVSSFDLTSYPWDGVVYSVPGGKHRGIWFSKAK